jgi:hypothetical protein
MSSISAVSQIPPSIPVSAAKPVDTDKPAAAPAQDHDGDKDASGVSVSAAKPPGQGKVVDIKT